MSMLTKDAEEMLGTREEFEQTRLSNCCGAKTTEPDLNGLAICRECQEGCVAELEEDEDLIDEKINQDTFEDLARDAMEDLGLEDDEAEAMLEDFRN